mgnify:CR=1 FL=1
MRTLKLKVVHRILLSGILNVEGTKEGYGLKALSDMLKVFDKINFTQEETALLKIRQEDNQMKWDAAKENEDGSKEEIDIEKEFEVSNDQADLLKEIFKKKDEKKEFTLSGLNPIVEIADQIGYEIK